MNAWMNECSNLEIYCYIHENIDVWVYEFMST